MSLFKWEIIAEEPLAKRLRVPNGWVIAIRQTGGGGVCFVPDPRVELEVRATNQLLIHEAEEFDKPVMR